MSSERRLVHGGDLPADEVRGEHAAVGMAGHVVEARRQRGEQVRARLCRSMVMISPVIEEIVTSASGGSNFAAGGTISPSMKHSGVEEPSIETRQISPPISGKYRRPSGPTAIALGWGRPSSIDAWRPAVPIHLEQSSPVAVLVDEHPVAWHVMPFADGRSSAITAAPRLAPVPTRFPASCR